MSYGVSFVSSTSHLIYVHHCCVANNIMPYNTVLQEAHTVHRYLLFPFSNTSHLNWSSCFILSVEMDESSSTLPQSRAKWNHGLSPCWPVLSCSWAALTWCWHVKWLKQAPLQTGAVPSDASCQSRWLMVALGATALGGSRQKRL